jgi:hypothetical protein
LLKQLQKPYLFDFIQQHNLYAAIHNKVVPLMRLDGTQAVQLLVNQSNKIEAFEVVSQLQTGETDENLRKYLHLYLHGLFEKDPNAGKEYHGLQV